MIQLSIVLGYRNRDTHRIIRCLDSLQEQSYQSFEVIFVDYGSDLNYKFEVEGLVKIYPFVQYVYNDTRGMPWNRAHALNTGVRLAKGEYILFSDIDIIFSKNILKVALDAISPKSQINAFVYWLPEKFNDWSNLKTEPKIFKKSDTGAKGGFHLVPKAILEEIRGYDEYYCYWGLEDSDLFQRLEKLGLSSKWLCLEDTPLYHQWHPIISNVKYNFLPDKWWENMVIYLAINKNRLVRNNNYWGEIYTINERLTIQFLNNNNDFELHTILIPKEGDSYVKANIMKNIIDGILKLNQKQILEIIIHKEKDRNINFLNFFNNVSKKIHLNIFLMNKKQFINSMGNAYFVPASDILYTIWSLKQNTNIINDYFIAETEENITYLITSNILDHSSN